VLTVALGTALAPLYGTTILVLLEAPVACLGSGAVSCNGTGSAQLRPLWEQRRDHDGSGAAVLPHVWVREGLLRKRSMEECAWRITSVNGRSSSAVASRD